MQQAEQSAMFGFGTSFAAWSSGVSGGYISFTIDPRGPHDIVVLTCITGRSDAANGVIEVFNSSTTNGINSIYTTIVTNSPFGFEFGDDLRGNSGSSVVVRLNCASAGSIGVIGNRRTPSGWSRTTWTW